MEDGNGLENLITPLDPKAFENNRKQLVCTVLKGIDDSQTGNYMPAFKMMGPAELANVLNYLKSIKAPQTLSFTDREILALSNECR